MASIFCRYKDGTTTLYSGSVFSEIKINGVSVPRSDLDTVSITATDEVEFVLFTTVLGGSSFEDCVGLVSVVIDDNVTKINDRAFNRCSNLESVTIGSGVTVIESNVFKSCSKLTNVIIPENVTTIGEYAFYDCSNLESVTIGSGVKEIGNAAFRDCSKLTNVIIPEGVTTIGEYAFGESRGITSVTLPSTLTSIGADAFRYCESLATIISYAQTAPTITNTTFQYVANNGTLIHPEGADYSQWLSTNSYYLGYYGWNSATNAPDEPDGTYSVKCYKYGDGQTRICTVLNGTIDVLINGVSYGRVNVLTNGLSSEDEVEFIVKGEMPKFSSGTSDGFPEIIKIGEGCTEIPDDCFNFGLPLKSVTIPSSVTRIGYNAFKNCNNLTSLLFPSDNNVNFYGDYAFYNTQISVDFNNDLTYIGDYAFWGCDFYGTLFIPDGVHIGQYAFMYSYDLDTVNIGNNCSIGDYAFYESFKVIWENVNNYTYTGIKRVTIGNNCVIGDGAFYNCSNLSTIYCTDITAPTVTNITFQGVAEGGTLYYPIGANYSQWLSTDKYYLGYYGWNGATDKPVDPDNPDIPTDPDKPTIDLEYGDITAPQGGMNTTMDIETDNVDDIEIIAPDWVDVIEKDGYYEIIVKPNEDGSDRTGEVIFIGNPNKPNKVQQNLIINQNSDNSEMATSISLYKGTVYFDIMGDSEESTVKVKYVNATTINEPEPLADWISIFAYNTEETTEGANNIKTVYYSISVEENMGEEREEFIKLSCTDVKGREITNTSLLVRQTGVEEEEPDIIVSAFQKIGKVNYDGSSAGISIDTLGCGYKGVSPLEPTVDVDWIHLGEGVLQGGTNYTYDEVYRYPISFDVNEGAERVGVITFIGVDENGDEYTDTCTITQFAKPFVPDEPEKPEDTDNETYSPIWKDVEYVMGGDDVRYGIYTEETYRIGNQWFKEDVLLFSGRAYAAPNEVTVSVNVNKICQNYMDDNPNIFTGSVGYGHSFKTFKLKNEYGTLLHTYHFINDWTYKELTLGLKTNPIVPYIGDGQKLFFSTFAIDEKRINWGMRYYDGTPDYDNQERVSNDFGTLVVAPSREKGVKTFYFGGNSYNILPKCQCKYVLYYVNPNGGYDWFPITGRVSRRDRLETYTVTQNYNNTTADFGKKRYLSTINVTYQVNTQWLTQEQSNRMWELLESNTVWLHNLEEDKIYPVIITDTEIEHKYKTNSNKMLSYQINLELSQTRERI